jgi:hypothetical protein
MKKRVIGCTEKIIINDKRLRARIDTGARMSSIDKQLAKRLNIGPVIRRTKVKSVHGKSIRPVVRINLKIKNRNMKANFNLADRRKMRYPVLIGRNILTKGFLIDSSI